MELQLRPRFVLLIGALIAASGCTTETPPLIPEDARIVAPDGSIPMHDAGPSELTCEVGMIPCGDVCTNVVSDSQNCGSCGNVCPSGVTCALGRCECEAPMLGCDGLCVDPSTSREHCGACGNACEEGESCLEGRCVVQCDEPSIRCRSSEAEGPAFVCADVSTDANNCGGCGSRCAGGATCEDGRCACPSGQVSCSGMCTDLSTDANNCGACLNSCGADGVCTSGACSTCGTGLTACGSPARCTDTDTSRLHCGACDNTCGPGEGCNAGTCECLPGYTDCDGLCANLVGDPRNCGGCGIDCGQGGTCSAGVCSCAADATMCGAECAVLESDPSHCGACDEACEADEACYSGECLLFNDTCATARPVTADLVINREALVDGGPRPTGTNCGTSSGDKALYYAVTIPVGQQVAVVATSSGDIVLFEQEVCGTACVRNTDFPESLTLSNVFGAEPVTRIVGVRAWSSFSTPTYNISFTYSTPVVADNASCATATPVTETTTITGENTGTGGPRPNGTNCGGGSGDKALYYAVTIPAGQEVAVQTTPTGDIVLFEQAACGDTSCVASTDTSPERTTLSNVFGTGPVTHIVGVRAWGAPTTAPTYNIAFTYSTPVVAPNALCAAATAVTADATFTGENTGVGGPRATGTNCGGGTGAKALYYAVTIPAGEDVTVQTTPTGDIVLFEQAACGDTACVASTDSSPERTILSNAFGTSEVTRIVGVRAFGAPATAPTYDIQFTYSTPVVAPNALCMDATSITADSTITGEDTATGGPRATGANCGSGTGSKALYYAVTIPVGQEVAVQTTPMGDIVLFEQAACGDAACVASTNTSPERLTLSNVFGTTDVTRIVGVRASGTPVTAPTYGIAFTYSTPVVAANASCGTATLITETTTLTGEDTEIGGARPTGTDCGTGESNKALYYAVTVGAGQTVALRATPATGVDLVLFEMAACGDLDCTDSVDDGLTSEFEELTLTNSGTSDITRIVGVRGWGPPSSSFPGGTFDITFTYTP